MADPNIVDFGTEIADGVYLDWGSGGPTGAIDGKQFTASAWFQTDVTNGRLWQIGTGICAIDSRVWMNFENSVGTEILRFVSDTGIFSGHGDGHNYHLMVSFDLADAAKRHVYVDGAAVGGVWSPYTIDELVDFTDYWFVGGINNEWGGSLSEIWMHPTYIDLSVAANRDKFYDTAGPYAPDLGANGENPTGSSPLVFLGNPYGTYSTNLGTGGDPTEKPSSWPYNSFPVAGSGGPIRSPTTQANLVQPYTEIYINGVMTAGLGTLVSAEPFIGQVDILDAMPYVRAASSLGETEVLLENGNFTGCIFDDALWPIPNTYQCGNFVSGYIAGTITMINPGLIGQEYAEMRMTRAQSADETDSNHHTDLTLSVNGPNGSWGDNFNRRMPARKHIRLKFRMKLDEGYEEFSCDGGPMSPPEGGLQDGGFSTSGWDIIWQIKYSADNYLNSSLNMGAYHRNNASEGRYAFFHQPDSVLGGTPGGAPAKHYGALGDAGNYFLDNGKWTSWVIDYFNSAGQTDGFWKVTKDGSVLMEVTNEVVGHYYTGSEGTDGFAVGIYKYHNQYKHPELGAELKRLSFDDVQAYEVVSAAVVSNPVANFMGEVEIPLASGSAVDTMLGNTVFNSIVV